MDARQPALDEPWFEMIVEASEYLDRIQELVSEGALVAHDEEQCVLFIVRAIQQTEKLRPTFGSFPRGGRQRLIWASILLQFWTVDYAHQPFDGANCYVPRE
jgi:hypothetical protein